MFLKPLIKRLLLKYKKNIIIDKKSEINFNVNNNNINSKYPCIISNSKCSFKTLHEGCQISQLSSYGNVNLGRFVGIEGPGTIIKASKESISIGSFSSIGQNVCIVDFNHNINRLTSFFTNNYIYCDSWMNDIISEKVIIEEDVFIGSNTVVLPGVTIGRGSVIGAGSVVVTDIPRYSIAVGNPAKVKKKRFSDEVINFIEDLRWWHWDVEKIKNNKFLFDMNLNQNVIKEIKIL
jgi:virginiamycin A acetyltransferase